ncbi:SDR family NAD(P)-dependent oxidoreductase [Nocardia abscessus]|uniref:SDR family NAD(P)-dependent oxidoreductase n=1 Tax=Nocardia abscessus TaxID=120957 RepID=UPI00245714A3|nr:SDR family oxidoreductase [Nocardia abscessus]
MQQESKDVYDLTGRTAIVTGGTRGIGREIAAALAAKGAHVVITGRKQASSEAAAAELSVHGDVSGVSCHMGDLDSIAALVEHAHERHGGIDIVVNNAANSLTQPMGSLTPDAFDKSIAVNLRGPLFLVEQALPYLKEGTGAAVLNIVSPWAFMFSPQAALYAMGKNGLVAATRAMAASYARYGIRVNALAPGATDTDMVRNNDTAAIEAMESASLLGRLGRPEEMVPPALLLVSDAGSFVTGQVLMVDGGTFPY